MENDDLFFDPNHPTMLASCARAATAEEARYRVQYPNSATRSSRVFALDAAAADAMYGITEDTWNNAHFLTLSAVGQVDPSTDANDLPLCHPDGTAADLEKELTGADIAVLLATDGSGEGAAEIIARECFERKIMCAGLALGRGKAPEDLDRVVNSMRRFARVLVVAQDDDYVPAMLMALRA